MKSEITSSTFATSPENSRFLIMQTLHVYYISNDIYVLLFYRAMRRIVDLIIKIFSSLYSCEMKYSMLAITIIQYSVRHFIFENRTLSCGNATLSIRITLYRSPCEL